MVMEIIVKAPKTNAFAKVVITKAQNDEMKEVPVLFKKNPNGRTWDAFVEDIDEDHKFGLVMSVDGKSDPVEVEAALAGKPDVRVTGVSGQMITIKGSEGKAAVKDEATGEPKELSDLWDEKIAAGIVTPEYREKVTWLFNNHKVNNFLRIKVVKSYRKFFDKDGNEIQILEPAHFYVNADPLGKQTPYDGSLFAEGLSAAINGQPIVYEGDKSTGKSVMTKTIAYVMHVPFWEDTYSEDMMRNDPLAYQSFDDEPFKHMTKEGAEAHMLWNADPDKFANYCSDAAEYKYWKDKAQTPQLTTVLGEMGKWAMYGGVYVANEANLARINVRESLFNPSCEDNNPHLVIPGYGMVMLNPACVLIATQNRDYAGTNGSNDAIDSRFGKLIFPYADHVFDQLKSMTESDCGKGCLPDNYYRLCDRLWGFFLGQVHDGVRENSVLSIRSFGKALKDVALGGGYATLHSKLTIYLQSMAHSDEEYRAIADDIHQYIGDM